MKVFIETCKKLPFDIQGKVPLTTSRTEQNYNLQKGQTSNLNLKTGDILQNNGVRIPYTKNNPKCEN